MEDGESSDSGSINSSKMSISLSSSQHLTHVVNNYSAFTVEALLDGGYMNPNTKVDDTGENAIHLCVRARKVGLLECFAKAGSNIEELNISGESPMDIALALGNDEVLNCLLELQRKTTEEAMAKEAITGNGSIPRYNCSVWTELLFAKFPIPGYYQNAFMSSSQNDYRVTVEGTVLPKCKRFCVNILNRKDIMIHFNPRISSRESIVVLNSIADGQPWGSEERIRNSPLRRGQSFRAEIYYSCRRNSFIVYINGHEEATFLSRIPPVNLERTLELSHSNKENVSFTFIKLEEIKL